MSVFQNAINFLLGKKQELDEEKIKLQAENSLLKEVFTKFDVEEVKPCRNKTVYNVANGSIQVITCEGSVYNGFNVASEIVELLKTADEPTIIQLLTPKVETVNVEQNNVEEQEKELVSNFLDIFDSVEDFEVVGKSLFFKNIRSVEIPSLIVARFVELIEKHRDPVDEQIQTGYLQEDEEYQSLKAFTLKLLLNPIQESREDCLTYVRNFNIKLTTTGNMIMYRRIVAKNSSNKDLVEFVSKQYLKIKSWKKSCKDYLVHYDGSSNYSLMKVDKTINWEDIKHAFVGNLDELYNNLDKMQENRYTDDYTKSYDIRIGATYKIREKDIDINKNGSCGGALHVADGKKFNYSGFGNTPVVCLISPQHVYKLDSGCSGKIGVKQMFIAAVTTQDEEGNYEDIDNQDLVNFDELYHNESIEELTQALQTKSLESVSVSTAVAEVSLKDIQTIQNLLSKRVITI